MAGEEGVLVATGAGVTGGARSPAAAATLCNREESEYREGCSPALLRRISDSTLESVRLCRISTVPGTAVCTSRYWSKVPPSPSMISIGWLCIRCRQKATNPSVFIHT